MVTKINNSFKFFFFLWFHKHSVNIFSSLVIKLLVIGFTLLNLLKSNYPFAFSGLKSRSVHYKKPPLYLSRKNIETGDI